VKSNKRKICVISSSRADYSHLYPLIKAIDKSPLLQLELVVTGMHLIKKYGLTFNEIKKDGFKINAKIDVSQKTSTSKDIIKSMSTQMINAYEVLSKISPDILVVLGDRYDIHSIVTCANILNIPVAHFHGGEITVGAIDDSFRHSITKMAHLHFTADNIFRKRVIQMGENKNNVFNIGSLGNLGIIKNKLFKKSYIDKYFKLKDHKYILVSVHPETVNDNNKELIDNILKKLDGLNDTGIIFTSPNSDTGSDYILRKIHAYIKKNPHSRFIESAGRKLYLSLLKNAWCIIGNSSSCLIEAPYLNTPTVLVGHRQTGRPISSSVLVSDYNYASITKAFDKLKDKKFIKNIAKDIKYLPKKSLENILSVLSKTDTSKVLLKGFSDL
jgi:GDP/UDP-N,N'-diacetylbacillosamine 2-epimerase (hydrolysing)